MIPNASTQSIHWVLPWLQTTLVARRTQIVAGNSMGVLHRAVPNHKFNHIFLKEWRIATNYHPEYSPHRTNFRFEISSRINAIKEYVAASSSRSKQYMPRKFAEMSSKFRFDQEFVEKQGISSNFVDRCLYYFCTILYVGRSSSIGPDVLAIGCCCNPSRVVKCTSMFWKL